MLRDYTVTGFENDLTFAPECIQTDLNYNNSGQRPAASGQRPELRPLAIGSLG